MTKETWKDIPGYEGLYKASSLGNIYSIRRQKCFATKHNVTYPRVLLSKNGARKSFAVHRLIAITFLPNPDNLPQVHHIDGNHFNNAVDNLQWITREDNQTEYFNSDYFKKYVEEQRRFYRAERERKNSILFGTASKVGNDQEAIL